MVGPVGACTAGEVTHPEAAVIAQATQVRISTPAALGLIRLLVKSQEVQDSLSFFRRHAGSAACDADGDQDQPAGKFAAVRQ
jgi:hypothetical protein